MITAEHSRLRCGGCCALPMPAWPHVQSPIGALATLNVGLSHEERGVNGGAGAGSDDQVQALAHGSMSVPTCTEGGSWDDVSSSATPPHASRLDVAPPPVLSAALGGSSSRTSPTPPLAQTLQSGEGTGAAGLSLAGTALGAAATAQVTSNGDDEEEEQQQQQQQQQQQEEEEEDKGPMQTSAAAVAAAATAKGCRLEVVRGAGSSKRQRRPPVRLYLGVDPTSPGVSFNHSARRPAGAGGSRRGKAADARRRRRRAEKNTYLLVEDVQRCARRGGVASELRPEFYEDMSTSCDTRASPAHQLLPLVSRACRGAT
jgi:pyruvate/2-oxoglutarate dehydrogenase complex dihydrolipoamide acyltransferase (E2) component